jgi:hypothetical protein
MGCGCKKNREIPQPQVGQPIRLTVVESDQPTETNPELNTTQQEQVDLIMEKIKSLDQNQQ